MFRKLKQKMLSYIIYTVNENRTEIIVQNTSDSREYQDFVEELDPQECRWGVYDFEFENDNGDRRNTLVLMSWCVLFLSPTCLILK